MKKNQSQDDSPLHQTVAEGFEFKNGRKSIAVEFTDQKLSAHAGSTPFGAWLHGRDWSGKLAAHLPHRAAVSNNHLTAVEKALAFTHGLLCEARKLTHVAYFRRDPLVLEMLGIRRIACQSSLSRFFCRLYFGGSELALFPAAVAVVRRGAASRREGFTLDLDSTRLLHEDGHQEGGQVGCTRAGFKPCLHPLLAILAEARLVANLWLRAGDTGCGNNVVPFYMVPVGTLAAHTSMCVQCARTADFAW